MTNDQKVAAIIGYLRNYYLTSEPQHVMEELVEEVMVHREEQLNLLNTESIDTVYRDYFPPGEEGEE